MRREPYIVQSPASWHTHEVDPVTWYKQLKAELERIENTPPHLLTPTPNPRD